MKNACCYIRVSTHGKQEELSPDTQKQLVFDYCKSHGYVITEEDVFMDLGIRGKYADKRPNFMHMIGVCKSKEHPYDAIIVWKFSRFARNQEESVIYKRMLKKIGVDVISVSEPISDDIGGRIAESIFEIMDEYYSINLSQEVMRGMTENAKRGVHQCRPPYGYKKIKEYDDSGNLIQAKIVKTKDSEIVKKIFEMHYYDNIGTASIAVKLNEQGIPSPSKRYNWSKGMVKYILQNPFYCGRVRWNYRSGGRTNSSDIKDESEWIITKGTHEPIISEEIFDSINSLFDSRRIPGKKERSGYKHWLGGMLRCPKCGKKMCYQSVKKSNGQRHRTYVCSGYKSGICDNKKYLKVEFLEEHFVEGLQAFINDDKFQLISKQVESVVDYEYYERMLADIDKKEKRIKIAYMDGIDTIDEYKSNKAILSSQREEILLKMSNTKPHDNHVLTKKDTNSTLYSLLDILNDESVSVCQKNEQLKTVIDYLIYKNDEDVLEFHFL